MTDLKSTHGTLVNGQRIGARTALSDGDRVRCGETEFVFVAPGGARGTHGGTFMLDDAQFEDGARSGDPSAIGRPPAVTGRADPERLRAIGETVATLSHSVKNILQGLRSGADAVELGLGRGDLDVARQGWPIVARNLDRISWLVMNMLAFAKERPLEIAPTDLGAVVRDVCDLMQATAARKRVKLTTHIADGLPPAPVDANAVHQILLNLLANAIEAAPDRTGQVEVRAVHDAVAGTLCVRVQDNGPGVPAEQREWLFRPFASTKGQRGTGLGLVVALKLAEQHQGTVRYTDAAGAGSGASTGTGTGTGTIMTLALPDHREDPDSERTRGPIPGSAPDIAFE